MSRKMNRRDFVKQGAAIGMSAAFGGGLLSRLGAAPIKAAGRKEVVDVAVAAGPDYMKNTVKAVELLGSMEKFVPRNAKVALLPNVQSRHPGTFTKPEILRAVIRMCKEAGAGKIHCLSWLSQKHWEDTGLWSVAGEEGAEVVLVERDEALFRVVPVPGGKALEEARIMVEFFKYDVFINMPITKDHAGNKFTGTLKNLMGLNSPQNNRTFHKPDWKTDVAAIEHLDQCIVDLNKVVKPALGIVDATEFITTNGPFGPGEIIKPLKVVAGVDRVAVDTYCASLWGLKPADVIMIERGHEQGLGEMDLARVRVKEVET